MLDFCIIGSGISGSTIANLLNKKYSVAVYDKARGFGGRSSFKKFKDKVGFDHGLQYISPKSTKFKIFTNQLIKKKVLKKWGGNHLFLHKTVKEIKNHIKLIGTIGNNSISKHLLKKIKCNFEHARRICIKLFTEGKIERTKIVEKVGRPFFKYWKK